MPSPNIHTVELAPAGYLYSLIVGETTEQDAEHIQKGLDVILARNPAKKLNVIINIAEAKTASVGAIKIYAGLMQNPQINKIAFVGGSNTAQISARLAEHFSHKEEINFFASREEAEKWVSES